MTNEETRGDLVLLQTCGDNQAASLIKARLEAEGILCVVQGENHRSMLGIVGAYIELRVLVPESELERARTLITVPADELEQEAAASMGAAGAETMLGVSEDADPRAARRKKLVWIYFGLFWLIPLAALLLLGR